MPGEPVNAAEALSREIERVTTLLGHYRAIVNMPRVSPLTAVLIRGMEVAIANGHRAQGSGDAVEVIRAIKGLQEWEE